MFNELKVAARSLARNPVHTSVVVLTLGLGLGTATSFYSLLKQQLVSRAPYAEPERLVRVELHNRTEPGPRAPFLTRFHAYRSAKSIAMLAGAWSAMSNVLLGGEPQAVFVTRISADFLPTLGAAPSLGRGFSADEYQPSKDNVALLTDWFWRNRLGSAPDVLQRDLMINGRVVRVVGVLPKGFALPSTLAGERTVLLPFPLPEPSDKDAFQPVVTIGRLAPGATVEQLQAELDTMRPETGKPFEKFVSAYEPRVVPINASPDNIWARRYYRMLWTSLGAVACLFAIAALNAGSLVLVRMLGRQREIGIRLALGAGRWQVMRPLLWEALLLAIGVIAAGGLIARWLMPALLAFSPTMEAGARFQLSGEAWVFLAAAGTLTGCVVMLAPAWAATRQNINDIVKDGSVAAGESRASRRLRGALVVIEAALAVILLTGAGLMVRSFLQVAAQKPGYETVHRYIVQFNEETVNRPNGDALTARRRQMIERLSAVPGVTEVGLAMAATPSFYFPQRLQIVGRSDGAEIEAMGNPVSPELLTALGIPLRAGRPMAEQRPSDPPGVWINETMARRYFAGRNPIGERLSGVGRKPWEIAGVVGDQLSQRDGAKPRFYFPYWQVPQWAMNQVMLRLTGEPGPKFEAEVRRALYEIDPAIVVLDVRSLAQHRNAEVGQERFAYAVLRLLAVFALLLAGIGLFAMLAFTVSQRRAEFGVRLALGASTASLYRLVLGSGVGLAAAGVAIGLAVSWGLARFLDTLLIGVAPHDPLTFAGVGLLMLAVALPACWLPARRAARVDVTTLLRRE